MIVFAVFVWFTMKFVWGPIVGVLDERKATIADGLAASEKGLRDQELAADNAVQVIKEAK